LGYRLENGAHTVSYIPDHEPALGNTKFPDDSNWTSGFRIARQADLLIHDSQYTDTEYQSKHGWGHSAASHLLAFSEMAEAANLVTFHHDPGHTDGFLDEFHSELESRADGVKVVPGIADLEISASG
jgi:phosphoribosyl 1,2-cyclic phosphodiesterase